MQSSIIRDQVVTIERWSIQALLGTDGGLSGHGLTRRSGAALLQNSSIGSLSTLDGTDGLVVRAWHPGLATVLVSARGFIVFAQRYQVLASA